MTIERMFCGHCGYGRVTLRAVYDGNRDSLTELRAKCCNCKDVTVFRISAPAIVPDWGKGARGVLCAGWSKNHKPPKRAAPKGAAS